MIRGEIARNLTSDRAANHNASRPAPRVGAGRSRPPARAQPPPPPPPPRPGRLREPPRAAIESRDRPIATQTPDPTAAPARTVLIVDDNVTSAETLALLIGLSGHATHVAHSGAAALEAAERHRPEVILLDIGLPGMDGFEVARQVRQAEDGRRAVLIAVTGYGQDDDRRKSAEAGFDHHLVKPIDLARLEELLNAA